MKVDACRDIDIWVKTNINLHAEDTVMIGTKRVSKKGNTHIVSVQTLVTFPGKYLSI